MSKTAILLDFLITLGNIKGTGITAYAAMTEDQKQAILNRAHNVRSEREYTL